MRLSQALHLFGLVQDLTDNRAAVERLHESEAFLRLSMEAGRIGTFRHDFVTGLIECGPEARAGAERVRAVLTADRGHTVTERDRVRDAAALA